MQKIQISPSLCTSFLTRRQGGKVIKCHLLKSNMGEWSWGRLLPINQKYPWRGEGGDPPPPSTHFLFSNVQTFWNPFALWHPPPPKPATPWICMLSIPEIRSFLSGRIYRYTADCPQNFFFYPNEFIYYKAAKKLIPPLLLIFHNLLVSSKGIFIKALPEQRQTRIHCTGCRQSLVWS